VNGAKSGVAGGKYHDSGVVGDGTLAAVSANVQALVDKLACEAETPLELAAPDTG
jgi:hypothetical protein